MGVAYKGWPLWEWPIKDDIWWEWPIKDGLWWEWPIKDGVWWEWPIKDGLWREWPIERETTVYRISDVQYNKNVMTSFYIFLTYKNNMTDNVYHPSLFTFVFSSW